MALPISPITTDDIRNLFGITGYSTFGDLCNYSGVNGAGLDPTYCSGADAAARLANLRSAPYEIAKFRNYVHAVNVTYTMDITTSGVCTPMSVNGWNYTLSHNVAFSGLPVGNTVDVHLHFSGGLTLPSQSYGYAVTYSVYGNIYKNSVLQPSYVSTGYFTSPGNKYFTDQVLTLSGIISTDVIIVNRQISTQEDTIGDYSGWWGSSMCHLSVSEASGVPINLIPLTADRDMQSPCN